MYLIFYDISDDKVRTKVANILQDYGYERLQYSVFAGPFHPRHKGLWSKLELLLKHTAEAHNICCLKISENNFKKMRIIGCLYQDLDYICGEKSSLIF